MKMGMSLFWLAFAVAVVGGFGLPLYVISTGSKILCGSARTTYWLYSARFHEVDAGGT